MGRCDRWLVLILAAGLGLRLIQIDGPPIDQQAWRQADTAAMARNFLEEGLDLLHPRVDWRGAGPLSALLSTGAALLLHAFLRRLFPDPWVGRLGAALFLVTPMSWFFGRALMPEGNRKLHYYQLPFVSVVGDVDENAGTPDRTRSPTVFYYCHRKGCQITPNQFSARGLDSLAALGATHFVSAAHFAMEDARFWSHLLARGVSTPTTYPARSRDHRQYLAEVRA